ncbi:hypothetical protein DBT42_09035, partial [Aerococcus urinae]
QYQPCELTVGRVEGGELAGQKFAAAPDIDRGEKEQRDERGKAEIDCEIARGAHQLVLGGAGASKASRATASLSATSATKGVPQVQSRAGRSAVRA